MDIHKCRLVLMRLEPEQIPGAPGEVRVTQLPEFLDGARVLSHTIGWSLDGAALLSVLCDEAPKSGWPV